MNDENQKTIGILKQKKNQILEDITKTTDIEKLNKLIQTLKILDENLNNYTKDFNLKEKEDKYL